MKKIVSLFIAVALIATFLCTAAFAAGAGVVYGDSNVAAKPGDTVTVTIYISGNPGFDAAGLTASAGAPLTVTGVSAGAKMPGGYANGNKVNHFSTSLIEGDGVMCYVTVKVAEDAESGVYPVSISGYVTNTDVSVASISGGSVKVTAPEKPTEAPTEEPTEAPTEEPTKPTEEPTEEPTEAPTEEPTKPTEAPTEEPTKPTEEPTKPSEEPTKPSEEPTEEPTKPSEEPTEEPTTKPTEKPTDPTKPTKPGKDDQPKNGDVTPYPVFFLMAVMAVAATAFVLKRKFDV